MLAVRRVSPEITVSHELFLSPLAEGDKLALVEHLRDPRIAERMLRIPYPYTIADAHQWLTLARAKARTYGRELVWAIRDREAKLVGCAAFEIESGVTHKAELGYWLAAPYWGRGWMTAVVQALCEEAFVVNGWLRLGAKVFADNVGSARVLEKAGFRQEARLNKYYYKHGRCHDALAYVKLR